MLFLHYALSQNIILYPYSNKWNAQIKMQKQSDAVNDMKWIVRGYDATNGINV